MRFKRIDVDTVRCIISEEELMENGLEVDDFLQNDGRTESFLRKIISMAEEEVGYKVQWKYYHSGCSTAGAYAGTYFFGEAGAWHQQYVGKSEVCSRKSG